MKSLADSINESRTREKEITAYVESWIKGVSDEKEAYGLAGAIVQGIKNGISYREDPDYIDSMDDKYKKATEVFKKLDSQLK